MSSTPEHNSAHSDSRKSEGAEIGHQGVERRRLVKGALVAAPLVLTVSARGGLASLGHQLITRIFPRLSPNL